MDTKKVITRQPRSFINILFLLSVLLWTTVLGCLLAWNIKSVMNQTMELASHEAKAFFNEVVTVRYWNSSHGGVYVPITPKTQPNPYLKVPDRDVVTTDGLKLTKLNPSYMNRQIGELAARRNNVWYHITSADPLRPENIPDQWEMAALKMFSAGRHEYSEFTESRTGEKVFRYMAPLFVEDSCLECHHEQGYKLGDLRGGISVTIQAKPILAAQYREMHYLLFAYLLIWIMGLAGQVAARYHLNIEKEEREKVIGDLQHALAEVKTLSGLLPICASCKKIRDDTGYWNQIEEYFVHHTEIEFSHGLCPDCVKKLYPDYPQAAGDKPQ
jgi:hypothetical protein